MTLPDLMAPSSGCCLRQRASCAQATVASKFHGEMQARPPRSFYPDLNSLRSAMGSLLSDFIPLKPFPWLQILAWGCAVDHQLSSQLGICLHTPPKVLGA